MTTSDGRDPFDGPENDYDPFADLAGRAGLNVGITELPGSDAWWLHDDQTILLDSGLDDIERRVMAAHMAAHLDLGHNPIPTVMNKITARAHRQEVEAQRLTAQRLIPVQALIWLLDNVSVCAEEVARQLRVTLPTLAKRMRNLTHDEWEEIRAATDNRLKWPENAEGRTLRCSILGSIFTSAPDVADAEIIQ
ncbi:hypothetical protein [Nocardia wallacei]|uniref:hypothetical protein n=1 Tax=Nocardia wallacei TaxID=480035 RepID=UPI002453F2E8|nr:hypothetical protein [Nocardia wallacei]